MKIPNQQDRHAGTKTQVSAARSNTLKTLIVMAMDPSGKWTDALRFEHKLEEVVTDVATAVPSLRTQLGPITRERVRTLIDTLKSSGLVESENNVATGTLMIRLSKSGCHLHSSLEHNYEKRKNEMRSDDRLGHLKNGLTLEQFGRSVATVSVASVASTILASCAWFGGQRYDNPIDPTVVRPNQPRVTQPSPQAEKPTVPIQAHSTQMQASPIEASRVAREMRPSQLSNARRPTIEIPGVSVLGRPSAYPGEFEAARAAERFNSGERVRSPVAIVPDFRSAQAQAAPLVMRAAPAASAPTQSNSAAATTATRRQHAIFFDTGKSTVNLRNQEALTAFSLPIAEPGVYRIVSRTDRTGSPSLNKKLADARARSTSMALIAMGVRPEAIRTVLAPMELAALQPLLVTQHVPGAETAKARRVDVTYVPAQRRQISEE
jgi:outer membrane protein OmpA-like peptidoglycan-associated protein